MQSTATRTVKQARKPARLVKWLRHDGKGKGVLQITMKADTASPEVFVYGIAPIAGAEFGPAYAMAKINDEGFAEEVYNLNLADDSCECMGCLRHGHCKHLDAVKHLTAVGKI